MWIYLWSSNPSGVYIWNTPVRETYVWTTKIRPPTPYLYFERGSSSSAVVYLRKTWSPTSVTIQYSTDWNNWQNLNFGSWIQIPANGKLYFRNASTTDTWFSTSTSDYYYFDITWPAKAWWEVGFLLNKENTTTLTWSYCFYRLFYNITNLLTAPILNATTLTTYCYYSMFQNCSGLTTTPDLPVTTMQSNCYYQMFYNCTGLVTCCSLPATTLATQCYSNMFYGCSNLTTLPKLPATGTMPTRVYNSMFNGCSKIKLSQTQTGEYQTEYRIPTSGTGSAWWFSFWNSSMFSSTGWTFTGAPSINTTYYTSNTLV